MDAQIAQSLLLKAFRREPTVRPPIWMMRQAGRYQASYRALREKHALLDIVKTPELASQVTVAAVDEFDFDAAIIFSDILIVLEAMGLELAFMKGEGPKLSPLKEEGDFKRLRVPNADEAFAYTLSAIRMTSEALTPRGVPLIGFCGAPFTLACYAIEGGGSRDYVAAKQLAYQRPDLYEALCHRIVDTAATFLIAQARAGACALQIFDSWAGILSPSDYATLALPYAKALVERVRCAGVPIVYFSTGTGSYLPLVSQTRADVIGIDWRTDLGHALGALKTQHAVQGNLDPALLFAPEQKLRDACSEIMETAQANSDASFIFNLGHGILQHTPESQVKAVVQWIKEWK